MSASRRDQAPVQPLSGRLAVVTGGGSGIGAAAAHALCEAGAQVVLIGRTAERLERQTGELESEFGSCAVGIAADVTDAGDVERALARILQIGEPSILVNSAGGAESAPFTDTDRECWTRTIDQNLTSVYLCTYALLPRMIRAGYGRIINVASTAGLRGYRFASAYTAAKHAVVGLTRALAIEVDKQGVTVNAVCPGFTRTEALMAAAQGVAAKTGRGVEDILAVYAASNKGGKLIEPDEVGEKIVWFCLPEQDRTTGEAMPVEGRDD